MTKPKQTGVNPDGTLHPVCELDPEALHRALIPLVHGADLKRAVKRLTKADSLRPLRPARPDRWAPACSGKSLLEMMWEELDRTVERLMAGAINEDDKGYAQGLTFCIALVENPYYMNVETVRDRAMARWEKAQDE